MDLQQYQQQFSPEINPTIAHAQWLETPPEHLFFQQSETILGDCTVLFIDNTVYAFSLRPSKPTLDHYQKKWPRCKFQESATLTPQQLLKQQRLQIACVGSQFQLSVWQQLLHFNQQGLFSYQDIANALGKPTAVRAVANAVGANPIAIFLPCHRVIYSNGSLGGYHYGTALKQRILHAELNHFR